MSLVCLITGFVLAFAVFSFFFWWFVDKPTRILIRIVESAPSKDFLVRAPEWSGIVIGKLARSFNQLLEQITTFVHGFKLSGQ